jgi:hypothetical protein
MKFKELSQELQELWTRGVDHSVFNEDWARMGGVVEIEYKKYTGAWYLYPTLDVLAKAQFYCGHWEYMPFGEHETFGGVIMDDHNVLSTKMASKERCAAAGIDYVPFMGWRDIESVPDDVDVLLDVDEYSVVFGKKESQNFYSEQVKSPCGYPYELKAKRWMPLPLV